MKKPTILWALSSTFLSVLPASAQQNQSLAPDAPVVRRETGVELDVGIGYGLPAGGTLADQFTGVLPLVFGLGYRLHPRFSVGPFYQS